jgi:hypothetical protein
MLCQGGVLKVVLAPMLCYVMSCYVRAAY